MEACVLLDIDVDQSKRPLPRDPLQQLLEVSPVSQGESAGVVLHLDPSFLWRFLPHRHDDSLRFNLCLHFSEQGRKKKEKKESTSPFVFVDKTTTVCVNAESSPADSASSDMR